MERNDPVAMVQESASRPGSTTIDGTFDLEEVARSLLAEWRCFSYRDSSDSGRNPE
jgi:hypothetical protein